MISHGVEISIARSGEEMVRDLAWGMPTCILSQVNMGDFSAFRVEGDFVRAHPNLGHSLSYGSSRMAWVIVS